MGEERIDVVVADKVSPNVSKKLLRIAESAKKANHYINTVQTSLGKLNTSSVDRLSQAQIKATQASATLTNATTKLYNAKGKLSASTERAKLSEQKLATEMQRTAAAKSRATAASDRASIAALRLKRANDGLNRSYSTTSQTMTNLIKIYAAFRVVMQSARVVSNLSDSYTILQNKLRTVSDGQAHLNELTKEVFGRAREARVSVEAYAGSFQRFDLALKASGASQDESLRLTSTLTKALKLGGATAQEAASALLQLSQSFNEGVLRGQEFRTLSQTTPALLTAIAKTIGVTRGELKKLGSEGKITTDILRKAAAEMEAGIAEKFANSIATVSESFVSLRGSAIKFFGELDKQIGLVSGLSTGVLFLADNFDILALATVAVATALIVGFIPAIWSGITAVGAFTLAIATNPLGLLAVALSTLTVGFAIFAKDLFGASENVSEFSKNTKIAAGVLEDDLNPTLTKSTGLVNRLGVAWLKVGKGVTTVVRDMFRYFTPAASKLDASLNLMLLGYDALISKAENAGKGKNPLRDSKEPPAGNLGAEHEKILLDLERQIKLASMLNNERRIETELHRISNELSKKGLELTEGRKGTTVALLNLLQEETEMGALRNTVIESSYDHRIEKAEETRLRLEVLENRGLITAKQHAEVRRKLWIKEQNEKLQAASSFFNGMAVLQNSSSKKAARIGKASAIASATINALQGIGGAIADTDGPIYTRLAAGATAAVQLYSIVDQIKNTENFANGGFVGGTSYSGDNVPINTNSGEAVLNANQQRNFMRMANGATSGTNSAGSTVNVTVENYGSSDIQVEKVGANEVRIIARDVLRQETDGVTAANLANPNSKTSRAQVANTNVQRTRR